MNRRILISLAAGAALFGGASAFPQDDNKTKPPMHMHKSNMNHGSDEEVAVEFKSEAEQLRERAESHRKLAQLYRGRTPPKGSASYESVAKHCDSLARFYENAAKEAEAIATELRK
jgi:hypothetical protein